MSQSTLSIRDRWIVTAKLMYAFADAEALNDNHCVAHRFRCLAVTSRELAAERDVAGLDEIGFRILLDYRKQAVAAYQHDPASFDNVSLP